jgi:hypothetical protein
MVRAINSKAVTWMVRVSTRSDEDSPAERASGLATSPKAISPIETSAPSGVLRWAGRGPFCGRSPTFSHLHVGSDMSFLRLDGTGEP